MTKVRSRIKFLQEKLEHKNIVLTLFGNSEGEFSFLDADESKDKLKNLYDIAYDNIIYKTIKDSNNNNKKALSKFELLLRSINKSNINELSLYVFGKKAYEVTTSLTFIFENISKIKSIFENQDILIHSSSLEFGSCLLNDEHFISISFWSDKEDNTVQLLSHGGIKNA